MAETITDILKSIQRHIKLETEHGAVNRTIGTGKAVTNGKEMRVWVTNRECESNYSFSQDREGWVTGHAKSKCVDTYRNDGPVLSKNSPWGRVLLNNCFGNFPIQTPRGNIDISIENSASYFNIDGNAKSRARREGMG